MTKEYFFLIFAISIFWSCNKSEVTTSDYTTKSHIPKFHYLSLKNNFEEIFSVVDSIQLETKNESITGKPWSVLVYKDIFVISDLIYSNRVLAFSKKGKFIKQIGSIGEGPGEYKSPSGLVLIGEELFMYDPSLARLTCYSLIDFSYKRSWGLKKYYESIANVDGKIILLNRYGQGYLNDYEIFTIYGESIGEGRLPKSLSEYKRKDLFGGSFKIANNKNRLIYIGADEYKLVCIDINSGEVEWVCNNTPDKIKVPELPKNVRELGHKWLSENYSPLYGLFSFDNGLIFIQADNYFFLYDYNGNYLTNIFNKNRRNIFVSDGQYLYEFTDSYEDLKGNLVNPKIYIYSLKQNS
ncbi:MAG: 6-bladed beta-propeller [Bacteroidales bacterium]|nr:6-bladed beta-propeller [Bacteroidales bacterium]